MRILICDDEPLIAEHIVKLCEAELTALSICASTLTFAAGENLLQYLQKNTADLLFLDISLKSMNGITLARQLNELYPVLRIIFVTGHVEMAGDICLSKYENFLLKPIVTSKFQIAFRQAINEITSQTNYIKLKIGAMPVSLDTRKIIYIASDRRKIILHCTDSIIQYYYKIDDMLEVLPDSFAQCHKSYIVNMDYIQSIKCNDVILKNQLRLPIAQKRQNFKNTFMDYLGV